MIQYLLTALNSIRVKIKTIRGILTLHVHQVFFGKWCGIRNKYLYQTANGLTDFDNVKY